MRERRGIDRRETVLVKGSLQFKYIKMIAAAIIALVAITGATSLGTFYFVLKTAQLGRYAQMYLKDIFFWLTCFLGAETLIFIVIGVLYSLHLSHRIAGPLYRLEMEMDDIIAGQGEKIEIREGDELFTLVSKLNELIEYLKTKK